MSDNTGAIQARYDYDPYGKTTKVSGSLDSDFQYSGYYQHLPSGLNLTQFRAYEPNLGRWLSRDPEGEGTGPSLYDYVLNCPVDLVDPLGLCPCGQHLEFIPAIFFNTMETMTFSGTTSVMNYTNLGVKFGLIPSFGYAAEASTLAPWLGGYNAAAALGSFIGSFRCMSDSDLPPPKYNAVTPSGMPYNSTPGVGPTPGTPGSPQLPTPNNYDSTGRYVPAPPGAPPDN